MSLIPLNLSRTVQPSWEGRPIIHQSSCTLDLRRQGLKSVVCGLITRLAVIAQLTWCWPGQQSYWCHENNQPPLDPIYKVHSAVQNAPPPSINGQSRSRESAEKTVDRGGNPTVALHVRRTARTARKKRNRPSDITSDGRFRYSLPEAQATKSRPPPPCRTPASDHSFHQRKCCIRLSVPRRRGCCEEASSRRAHSDARACTGSARPSQRLKQTLVRATLFVS